MPTTMPLLAFMLVHAVNCLVVRLYSASHNRNKQNPGSFFLLGSPLFAVVSFFLFGIYVAQVIPLLCIIVSMSFQEFAEICESLY